MRSIHPITLAKRAAIEGNGAIIERGGATLFRLFYVSGDLTPGLAEGRLTLKNLTLSNGTAKGGNSGGGGLGGAVFSMYGNTVNADLTLTNSILADSIGGNDLVVKQDQAQGSTGGGKLGRRRLEPNWRVPPQHRGMIPGCQRQPAMGWLYRRTLLHLRPAR